MLLAHLNIGLKVGITEPQLEDLFTIIEDAVGTRQADNGRKILKSVIDYRNMPK